MPQKLHKRDISTNTHVPIDRSLRLTGRMPGNMLRLWGFSWVRDAESRGNKITDVFFFFSDVLSSKLEKYLRDQDYRIEGLII